MARVSEDGDGDGSEADAGDGDGIDGYIPQSLSRTAYNYPCGSSPKKPGTIDIYAVLAGMGGG